MHLPAGASPLRLEIDNFSGPFLPSLSPLDRSLQKFILPDPDDQRRSRFPGDPGHFETAQVDRRNHQFDR